MLLNRKAFEVVAASSNDDQRPALESVHIESDGSSVATDGLILFRFTPTETPDEAEFPAFDGIKSNGTKLHPFSIPGSAARAILRSVPRERKGLQPILRNILVDAEATNKSEHAVLAFTDLKRPTVIRPQKVVGDFPDWQKVMPKGKVVFKVALKVTTLKRALKVIDNLDVEWVTLHFRDPQSPVEIRAKTSTGDGTIMGLMMPSKLSKDDEPEAKAPEAEKAPEKVTKKTAHRKRHKKKQKH